MGVELNFPKHLIATSLTPGGLKPYLQHMQDTLLRTCLPHLRSVDHPSSCFSLVSCITGAQDTQTRNVAPAVKLRRLRDDPLRPCLYQRGYSWSHNPFHYFYRHPYPSTPVSWPVFSLQNPHFWIVSHCYSLHFCGHLIWLSITALVDEHSAK